MKEIIRKTLLVVCSIVFFISAALVGKNLYEYYHNISQDNELTETVKETSEDNSWRQAWQDLKAQNSDFYAWLSWDSGIIDTPVMMESADNTDYYLTHKFDGSTTELGGSAFVANANTREDNQNLVIYGHAVFYYGRKTMPLMFSPLLELVEQENFDANKTFWLHFENEDQQYELVYVCDVKDYTDEWNWEKKDFGSEEEFNEWQASAIEKNVVTTDAPLTYNDTLVTFQTCQQLYGSSRLVLIAKRIA